MSRNKIVLEICEESDDGMKISVKMHDRPFSELQAKYEKKIQMTQIEVAAHFMITRFMEFHQRRALLTVQNKEKLAKPQNSFRKNFFGGRN